MGREARAALLAAGSDPPRLTVLAERLGVEASALQLLLDKLARVGWLCRASASYYLLPEVAAGLADAARRVAAESATGLLTVGRSREATGMTRHATMPVLEYFDRTGLTRGVPEGREIREAHTAADGVEWLSRRQTCSAAKSRVFKGRKPPRRDKGPRKKAWRSRTLV